MTATLGRVNLESYFRYAFTSVCLIIDHKRAEHCSVKWLKCYNWNKMELFFPAECVFLRNSSQYGLKSASDYS